MTPLNLTQNPNCFLTPGQKGSSGIGNAQRSGKNINQVSLLAAYKTPPMISFKGAKKPPGFIMKRVNHFIDNSKIPEKIINNKWFRNTTLTAEKSAAVFETIASVAIVGTLRPLSIFAAPGAEKEDKQLAIAHSYATLAMETAFAILLLTPVSKAINSTVNALKKSKAPIMDAKALAVFKNVVDMGSKFASTPFRAAATIAVIPPIMKKLFPEAFARKQNKYNTQEKFPEHIKAEPFKFLRECKNYAN